MLKRRIATLFLLTLGAHLSMSVARAQEESFYETLSRAVFRLELSDASFPKGSAFVVRHDSNLFLVTARHVVNERVDLRARVPVLRTDTTTREIIELRIPASAWVFHPLGSHVTVSDGDTVRYFGVDVAVALLPGIKERKIASFQVADVDPEPPLSVILAGYPGNLGFVLTEQKPLVRSAVVAMRSDEYFLKNRSGFFIDDRAFVLDRSLQGGFSGSPVFTLNPPIRVVGIQISSNENWDYSVAEPASRIKETLDHASRHTPPKRPSWHLLEH